MSNFADIFFQDYVYQQEPDGSYRFDPKTNDIALCNKNECIDTILSVLEKIYKNIIISNNLRLIRIKCDVVLLDQALEKYSRDVFGEIRLRARVEHSRNLSESSKANLLKYADYGIKIDSTAPYIHRKMAVLLYWLSTLKPFSTDFPADITLQMKERLGSALEFHNEYISYILVMAALVPFDMELNVHDNPDLFKDFLYELHYRNLSRSSLEFFLHTFIVKTKSKS